MTGQRAFWSAASAVLTVVFCVQLWQDSDAIDDDAFARRSVPASEETRRLFLEARVLAAAHDAATVAPAPTATRPPRPGGGIDKPANSPLPRLHHDPLHLRDVLLSVDLPGGERPWPRGAG